MYGWPALADADRVRQDVDTRLLVSVTITRPDRHQRYCLIGVYPHTDFLIPQFFCCGFFIYKK